MTGTLEGRDEAQIIASILAGDSQQFHQLIRPYERSVYAMALSMLKNAADAEDVAQEAFLKAFRNLGSFRADSKFSTWLVSITLNEARSRLRRNQAAKIESLDIPSEEQGHVSPTLLRDWREVPSEILERQEVRLLLQEAVLALPEIYREVFLLREVEEMSVKEAAEALGVSDASVKVRLHRARIMLQKKLAPELKKASSQKRRWLPWL
ncbi:MAG TPA: sigma-70 family RNA polymerase sigma factor [Acidobacteriaceae bacterium]|jgi:RNA polymerase sigma-70 factor (ECF subfamily)|nr:sigma-70 family RNA polymerase sigma factor [Acidobacteriaceae bacterium]